MPLSYASYAGNGSTTSFSVPFPYILKAHVKVYLGFNILNGTYTSELVDGTGFNWASGTQIQCTTAPAVGQTLTVIRQTPSSSRLVDWNDGSNLIAADLDTADLQNLYVVQEQQDRNDSGITQSTAATAAATAATTAANTATSTANTALSTANTALTNANAAVSTANTASTNASAAVSTANTASTNASAAVTTANAASSTANTASTNASNAVTTANAAAANASTALSTANTALSTANAATSTANTASSNASAAVTTANTASTNASNAVTTANTASTNASAAVSTANTASTNATTAVNTANTANNKADQAIAAVSNSINYQLKANVAAIPASPANDTYIEVQDSTGLESFTPLAGMPAGFVGDSGLSVRLRFTSAGSTWNWLNYYANNSDSRYLKLTGGTLTGQIKADDSTSAATPGYAFDGDPNTGVGRPGADELALITGGTARLTIDSAGNVAVAGALTKGGSNVVTVGDSGTVTSAMLADGTIVNADINAAAAIDKTKISGTAITAADTGTVTSTMIADGTILNADVNAAAAIAGTKISPDFGSQNVTTTGTSTAASFIPSSSTAPTNGVYLPAANTVGISTNGTGRLFIDSSGRLLVGVSSTSGLQTGARHVFNDGSGAAFTGVSVGNPGGGLNNVDLNITAWSGSGANYFTSKIRQIGDGSLTFQTQATSSADGAGTTTERLRITSAGLVGIGTSTPGTKLHIAEDGDTALTIQSITGSGQSPSIRLQRGTYGTDGFNDVRLYNTSGALLVDNINSVGAATNMLYASTTGVGIGTQSPGALLHVTGSASPLTVQGTAANVNYITHKHPTSGDIAYLGGGGGGALSGGAATDYVIQAKQGSLILATNGDSEKARVDTSGRLLVGTSTAGSALDRTIELHNAGTSLAQPSYQIFSYPGTSGGNRGYFQFNRSRGTSVGDKTIVASGDYLGTIAWNGGDGSGYATAAEISAIVEGTPAAGKVGGRLTFSTTADGASSPTERLRIANNGAWGLAGANYGSSGQVLTSNGSGSAPTWSSVITRGTAVASTSGTAIDFTGIPSTVKRITLIFNGVSINGTSQGAIRLGTSSGIVSTGYTGAYAYHGNGSDASTGAPTAHVGIWMGGASDTHYVNVLITNITGNTWVVSYGGGMTSSGNGYSVSGGGSIALSGTLDRVRITTGNGTDTFDAGTINIMYES